MHEHTQYHRTGFDCVLGLVVRPNLTVNLTIVMVDPYLIIEYTQVNLLTASSRKTHNLQSLDSRNKT